MASSVYSQRGKRYTFRPYQPPPVPTGSYDPALDAQLRAGQRGLGDLTDDAQLGGTRGLVDFGLGQDDINRGWARNQQDIERGLSRGQASLTQSRDRGLADLGQSRERGLADLGTSRARGGEDYGRAVAMLTRQYAQLGDRQQEQQNAAGVLRGGAALQAATKRSENEALDRQPLDTNFSRFNADNDQARGRLVADTDQARTRLGEDYTQSEQELRENAFISAARGGEDKDLGLGRLGSAFNRQSTDLNTQLLRGQREQQQFGLDVGAQKMFQASQMGYVPPQRGEPGGMPSNQFTAANGSQYRTIRRGNEILRVDAMGRILSRRRAG